MTDATWRTAPVRIGVLVPGRNPVHEREFALLRTGNLSFRFAGFFYPPKGAADFCAGLISMMTAPLKELEAWGPELLLVGCTTASMVCDQTRFRERLEQMVGVPVVTAASASREAITALDVRKVAVASPYGEGNNRIIRQFLHSCDVEVAAMEGLALDRSPEIWHEAATLSAEQVLQLALRANVESAEALYLPCTGVASLQAIERIEQVTSKPAFSSVQAGFWASLRRLGIDGRTSGYGRLLSVWKFP